MSMERGIITMNESGNIIMPENVADIWMSELEFVELFGVIAPTIRAAIRAVYKSSVLKEYEVQEVYPIGERLSCRCVQLPDGGRTCFPHQYFRCGTSAQCHS